MACREGCRTKDHRNYSDCLRSATVQVAGTVASNLGEVYDKTKGDLAAYRTARSYGIQPGGTSIDKVRKAEDATKALGRPYDAGKDPPAGMITSKSAVRFVNWKE